MTNRETELNINIDLDNAPEWATQLLDNMTKLIATSHTGLSNQISEITRKHHHMEEVITSVQEDNEYLQARMEYAESRYEQLQDILVHQETERRRDNLLLHGIAEEAWEKPEVTENLTREFLSSKLQIDTTPIIFRKFHRVGPRGRKARPILMTFHFPEDRQQVWKARQQLKDGNNSGNDNSQFLTQDFPLEVQSRRRRLVPIFRKAKETEAYRNDTFLRDDKLIIKGVTYTVHNIHTLKGDLNPTYISTCKRGDYIYFWGANSPLSNHHPSVFVVNGLRYNCVEQYYMHQMALHGENASRAHAIMNTQDPVVQKQIAKPARKDGWNKVSVGVMKTALQAKFTQNRSLRNLLVSTTAKFAEASPHDIFWGIGLPMNSTLGDHSNWRGKNKLGQLLSELRDELKKEEANSRK